MLIFGQKNVNPVKTAVYYRPKNSIRHLFCPNLHKKYCSHAHILSKKILCSHDHILLKNAHSLKNTGNKT